MSRPATRLACLMLGHRVTRVTRTGPRRFHRNPHGERRACHRCRTVLPERTGRRGATR